MESELTGIYKSISGGDLYDIKAVAEHTKTGEPLVIYQELYGDRKVYATPIATFLADFKYVRRD